MTRREFYQRLSELCKEASGIDEPTEQLIKIAMVMVLYPESVRRGIVEKLDAMVKNWAARQRQALETLERDDDRQWFIDCEWPEAFD